MDNTLMAMSEKMSQSISKKFTYLNCMNSKPEHVSMILRPEKSSQIVFLMTPAMLYCGFMMSPHFMPMIAAMLAGPVQQQNQC